MNDTRLGWQTGSELRLNGRAYRVEALVGMGSNAIVYRVSYPDGVSAERHIALLKELYPRVEGVARAGGALAVAPEAQEAFALHRQSYLRGNAAHLRQLARQAGRVSGNIDSFEAGGTLYTLLSYHAERTLRQLLDGGGPVTPERAARLTLSLLDALAPFHEENLLHLDISADNLLVLPALHGYEAECEPLLLIDYNGVWDRGAGGAPTLSSKAGYTPPEARIGDAASYGEATDLFAACAVFFEMLAGRRLTEAECCGQFQAQVTAAVEAACAALPQTARLQAVRILRKGLQPLPARRYQSAAALRQAVCELLDRIHGRGVTHAALWEAAAASLPAYQPPRRPVAVELSIGGQAVPAEGDWPGAAGQPLLLCGAGGSGKTTLLRALHSRYAARYAPAETICYYVPLYRWQGHAPFLWPCLTERLRPQQDTATQADVRAALQALLRAPLPGGKPVLLLLLDGLNEAGPKPEALYREIGELAALGGVRILAATRDRADLMRLPEGFAACELLPTAPAEVERFLAEHQLSAVTPPAARAMLSCPLLLAYYADTWEAWRESGQSLAATDPDFSTPEALLRSYVEGQVARFETVHRESGADCLRARYAAGHLLPALAAAMRGRPALSQAEAYAVVEKDYRALRGRAFARAYPAYLGKSRLLLEAVRTPGEWYDLALRECLCERLALMEAQPAGEVTLRHERFRPVLQRQAAGLRRRLAAVRLRAVAVAALCLCVLGGVAAGAAALLGGGQNESVRAAVRELESAQQSAMLQVSEVLGAQESVRAWLSAGEGTPRADALAPKLTLTLNLDAVPWKQAGLSREAWEAVLLAPDRVSSLYLGALLTLCDGYADGHSAAYREQRAEQYDSFTAAQKTYYLLTLYRTFAQCSQEAQAAFYDAMKYSPAMRLTFVATAQPQGGDAARRAACEAARVQLEQTLFYTLAVKEAQRWPGIAEMAAELKARLAAFRLQ